MLINDKPRIEIINADCLEYMRSMPDKSVDLVLTDPPYNINKFDNDDKNDKDYLEWPEKWIEECYRVLRDSGTIYVKHFWKYICEYGMLLKKHDWIMQNLIIWVRTGGMACSKRFSGRWEGLFFFTKGKNYTFNLDAVRVKEWARYDKKNNPNGKNPTDVWKIDRVAYGSIEDLGHPTPTKKEVFENCILASSNKGDLVLDPFMGSGTTGVACKELNRNFIGIEIHKPYFDIAKRRISQAVTELFV